MAALPGTTPIAADDLAGRLVRVARERRRRCGHDVAADTGYGVYAGREVAAVSPTGAGRRLDLRPAVVRAREDLQLIPRVKCSNDRRITIRPRTKRDDMDGRRGA